MSYGTEKFIMGREGGGGGGEKSLKTPDSDSSLSKTLSGRAKLQNSLNLRETSYNPLAVCSLLNDRASRFQRGFTNRRTLEGNWERAATEKREREHNEKLRMSTPGELVHEQLDRYKRCHQCKRKTRNVGESNIWCDTVYIPGSRYIC